MAGFKNGALALKKKDIGVNADPGFIHILVDTSNNLYTIDEFGVYRSIAGYDIISSGSDISVVTSGGTKILSLNSTGVVSGTYGTSTSVPQIVVDNKGRILSAYNIPISASGLGTVTSISISSSTLKVINSPITTFGTFGVNLSATGVVSGSILKPFVDSYGRVLSGGLISATDISDRSTDTTLSGNSDNKIPTEKAIKTYVDTTRLYVSTGISLSTPPNFVNNNDGTITIEPTTCRLYSTTDFTGNILEYNVAGTTLALTDGIEQHVCIKYNSGTPIYYVENSDDNINDSDVICVYIVWRQGLEIHSLGMDSLGLGLGNKTLHAINNTTPYKKSYLGGLVVSETVTPNPRTVLITSGNVYAGVVEQLVFPFNSSVDRLTLAYHNSGNWTYTDNLVYNNTEYDNGTDLVTIGNNKFSVRWFYRSIGDVKQTFYVLGSGDYNNISDARLELPRTDLPLLLLRHCVLVGRALIEYNATNGITEPISDISFSQAIVQNHNDLRNIQGGQVGEYYHLTSSEYNKIRALSALQEPTGFVNKNQTMSFNNSTRTFNISASSGFDIYYRGNVYQKTSDSITISNTPGNHFIYYTSAGVLFESTTPWEISTTVHVALVYWTGTSAFGICEERHGTVMDWATHMYNHKNFGTQYTSGFNATYNLNSDTSIIFGLSNGTISDEDIEINVLHGVIGNYFTQPINSSAAIPVYYRSGVDGVGSWRKDTATTAPYKNNGDTGVNFNQLSAGSWVQTPATNTNYVTYFIYATDNINEPIISVQGQRQDISLTNARNNNTYSSLIFQDFPVQEAKLLYRIILETKTSYSGNIYRVVISEVNDYRAMSVNLTNTGGSGTVTYVGLSANPIISVSGSPITNAGTFVLDFSPQSSGIFLSGPVSGISAIPTFRTIQLNDLPTSLSTRYLPLSGGTLTGQLKGTSISASGSISASNEIFTLSTFRSRLAGNYASVILNSNGAWLGIGTDGTSNNTLKIGSTAGDQNWTGNANLYVTGHLTLNNAFRPSWGSGRNFTMLGGTVSIGQTYSGGDYLIMHNNSYFDGTNNRSISATGYSSEMYIRPEGSFVFNTVANSGVNGIINYPTARFSVDKDGNGNFSGNISSNSFVKSGGASTQFLKADGSVDYNTYATTSFVGNYLPLSGGTLTGQLNGINSSFSGFVDGGNSRIQTGALGSGMAWFGYVGKNGAGAYIGYYATSAGGLRIASQTTQKVSIGTGANYDSLVIEDSGISVNGNISATQQIQTLSTFRSLVAGNYASVILNSNGAWLGIGTDGTSNNTLKIGTTNGDQNWVGVANLTLGGTVSAGNIYNLGNYYVSNYSGGGTPSLITNTGNARFYTLSLIDYNSTTGGGSLLFTDANIGATAGTFFASSGKQNAIQLKGSGDPGYGGLYFGQNNTEYIGVKGSGYLYLGSSTKVQIDSNQIQLFSTGSSTYNSTYDISISSTNGNVSLVAGSNLNTTSIYNTTIAANSQLSLTAHSNLSILCDSNVYINSTSGIIYTQATQNSKNIQNDLISVTATTAATTATNIYALPDDYNVYFLAQGTTTAYRNYRLPTPPSPKHIVLICGDSASGNLLCTIIRPSGRILYNSSGSSILSFQRGGAIPLYYDGTDWYCAVTV